LLFVLSRACGIVVRLSGSVRVLLAICTVSLAVRRRLPRFDFVRADGILLRRAWPHLFACGVWHLPRHLIIKRGMLHFTLLTVACCSCGSRVAVVFCFDVVISGRYVR